MVCGKFDPSCRQQNVAPDMGYCNSTPCASSLQPPLLSFYAQLMEFYYFA